MRLARIEVDDRSGEQLLGEHAHGLLVVALARHRHRGCQLDDARRIVQAQADDAPHALLRFPAALFEQRAAESAGVVADALGTSQDLPGLRHAKARRTCAIRGTQHGQYASVWSQSMRKASQSPFPVAHSPQGFDRIAKARADVAQAVNLAVTCLTGVVIDG